MRISDWSSDVCSSDLFTQELRLSSTANGGPVEWLVGGFFTSEKSTFQSDFQPVHADNSFDNDTTIVYGDDEFTHYKEYALFGTDRKRVVKGKSVSVRVDHGGRRIIKKKNSNTAKRRDRKIKE